MLLLRDAFARDVCDRTVLVAAERCTEINSGLVSTASLLHMYSRRLRRTEESTQLHADTSRLVRLLESVSTEYLSMISFRTEEGGFRLLLGTADEARIIFWMSMFDT